MAQVLDQSTFERSADSVGFVISYDDGVRLRAQPQSLATLSGSSLLPKFGETSVSGQNEALELALAMLARYDGPRFLIAVGDTYVPPRIAERAARAGIAVSSVDAPKHDDIARYVVCYRAKTPEDSSRLPMFGAFALLGLAGLLGRRQLF